MTRLESGLTSQHQHYREYHPSLQSQYAHVFDSKSATLCGLAKTRGQKRKDGIDSQWKNPIGKT